MAKSLKRGGKGGIKNPEGITVKMAWKVDAVLASSRDYIKMTVKPQNLHGSHLRSC